MIKLTISEPFTTDGSWIRNVNAIEIAPKSERLHYLSLLAQAGTDDNGVVARALRGLRILPWLTRELSVVEDDQLYFGAIAAKLREVLIDGPRPYRQDVKSLLVDFLD